MIPRGLHHDVAQHQQRRDDVEGEGHLAPLPTQELDERVADHPSWASAKLMSDHSVPY